MLTGVALPRSLGHDFADPEKPGAIRPGGSIRDSS
jgi:hypothetical protein